MFTGVLTILDPITTDLVLCCINQTEIGLRQNYNARHLCQERKKTSLTTQPLVGQGTFPELMLAQNVTMTLSLLGQNFSRQHFSYFSYKIDFDISCKLSRLFSEKK